MAYLLDVPNEVLVKLGSFLDVDSMISLSAGNARLQEVSQVLLTSVKKNKSTPVFNEWLVKNGPMVRRLDLSNTANGDPSIDNLMAAISRCPNITELNVVNAARIPEYEIFNLPRLEKLSMTVPVGFLNRKCVRMESAFRSLTELRLEVLPNSFSAHYAMDLVNLCWNLRVLHLHTIGYPRIDFAPSELPEVRSERWQILRTVVISRRLAHGNELKSTILRAVFANHSSPRILAWMARDLECHIYQDGNVNDTVFYEAPVVDFGLKLLDEYRTIDMSPRGDSQKSFDSSRRPFKSIRVLGPRHLLTELDIGLPATLIELDLTECHALYDDACRQTLVDSLHNLQILAFPICMFPVPEAGDAAGEEAAALQRRRFKDSLHKLRLRKLFLKGICHENDCQDNCSCNAWGCQRCDGSLTSANLIDLFGLDHLDELTIEGVNLDASAYYNMVNQSMRTLRLCLNAKSSYAGLAGLLPRCTALQRLKIESFSLDLKSEGIWAALLNGVNLEQVCLESGLESPPLKEEDFGERFRYAFCTVLRRVDILHIHLGADPWLTACLKGIAKDEVLKKKITNSNFPFALRRAKLNVSRQYSAGRDLCVPESFIGSVPAIGWDSC